MRTADSVKPKVKLLWTHEQGIYDSDRQAISYDDIPIGQFVQGFLSTVKKAPKGDRQHMLDYLQSIMSDTKKFAWADVHSFNAVFMQMIEQGSMTWAAPPRKS